MITVVLTLFTGCAQVKDLAGKIKHKFFDKDTPGTVQTTVQTTVETEAEDTSSEEKVTEKNSSKQKKLKVVLNATLPPYEYYYGDDVTGIDVDIARAIADKMGRELVIQDVAYTELFDELFNGDADITISALTLGDIHSKASIACSDVYYSDQQALVIRRKEEKTARIEKINSINDLKGLRIGVLEDSSSEFYSRYYFDSTDIEGFVNYNEMFSALVNNAVDGVVARYDDARRYLNSIPDLKFLDKDLRTSEYRIFSGDTELISDINKIVAKLKKDGTIDEIVKKYYSDPKYK